MNRQDYSEEYYALVRLVFDMVKANGGHSNLTVVCFQEDGPPEVVRV